MSPNFLTLFLTFDREHEAFFAFFHQNPHLWAQHKKKWFFSIFFFGCQNFTFLLFSQAGGLFLMIFYRKKMTKV